MSGSHGGATPPSSGTRFSITERHANRLAHVTSGWIAAGLMMVSTAVAEPRARDLGVPFEGNPGR
jgi:hypothetical protein